MSAGVSLRGVVRGGGWRVRGHRQRGFSRGQVGSRQLQGFLFASLFCVPFHPLFLRLPGTWKKEKKITTGEEVPTVGQPGKHLRLPRPVMGQ